MLDDRSEAMTQYSINQLLAVSLDQFIFLVVDENKI